MALLWCFTIPVEQETAQSSSHPQKERNCADGFVIDILQKMLQLDPANRISAIAAMDNPYFNSLDKSQF